MGKKGYTKCVELAETMIAQGKTKLTTDEIKLAIAKDIGFSLAHGTINHYFKALILFGFIKAGEEPDTYIIVYKPKVVKDVPADSEL